MVQCFFGKGFDDGFELKYQSFRNDDPLSQKFIGPFHFEVLIVESVSPQQFSHEMAKTWKMVPIRKVSIKNCIIIILDFVNGGTS